MSRRRDSQKRTKRLRAPDAGEARHLKIVALLQAVLAYPTLIQAMLAPWKRAPGGVSRSIDSIACVLSEQLQPAWVRVMALHDLSDLLRVVVQQAVTGNQECGYFLAELTAGLLKRRERLNAANEAFRKRFAEIESSRPETVRSSSLRPLIRRTIADAHSKRRTLRVAMRLPKSRQIIKDLKLNKALLALPELTSSSQAIDQWTDEVVYPCLRAMAPQLASDPQIGKKRKALDENGKFQISRLKPLIRDTVARIAALPRTYYIDL